MKYPRLTCSRTALFALSELFGPARDIGFTKSAVILLNNAMYFNWNEIIILGGFAHDKYLIRIDSIDFNT